MELYKEKRVAKSAPSCSHVWGMFTHTWGTDSVGKTFCVGVLLFCVG